MLDELEKLAREATQGPFGYAIYAENDWVLGPAQDEDGNQLVGNVADTIDVGDDVATNGTQGTVADAAYLCALVNAAPSLLAAVRAAEARPWLHRGQPPDPMIFGCDGCAGSIIDGDYIHGDGCDYRHIDAALDALKGSK